MIYGDGACGFSVLEFDTCVRNNIPIIAIVGNDAGWTQIARDQVVILEDDVATTLTYMDYHTVAEGCGAVGLLLKGKEDIIPTLKKAIQISREDRKPVLINVLIGKTDFRKDRFLCRGRCLFITFANVITSKRAVLPFHLSREGLESCISSISISKRRFLDLIRVRCLVVIQPFSTGTSLHSAEILNNSPTASKFDIIALAP